MKQGRRSLGAVMARFPLAEPALGGHPEPLTYADVNRIRLVPLPPRQPVTKLRDEQ
jgi:hypothetical protein